jgi:ribosome-binding protein aMBF1 (putative translation factor)
MIELNEFINELKQNREFADGFDEEYEKLKIGYLLKQARQKAGMTQEEMAEVMKTYKGNISRIENHAEDIKLSTLERFAAALGKKLVVNLQ